MPRPRGMARMLNTYEISCLLLALATGRSLVMVIPLRLKVETAIRRRSSVIYLCCGSLAAMGSKMRADPRAGRRNMDHWIVLLRGHQPPINTRVFVDVQQPICIVMALRKAQPKSAQPACPLPCSWCGRSRRQVQGTSRNPTGWKRLAGVSSSAPSILFPKQVLGDFPKLDELFSYDGTGVMLMSFGHST